MTVMDISLYFVLLLCFVVFEKTTQEEILRGVNQNSDGTGTIKFTTPKLDDEDSYSLHMPSALKCDGCLIVTHQMKERFDVEHGKRKSLSVLSETDIIDILDRVCTDKYESCGLKEINGVKRLSGPGLDTVDVPGVMQGGGRWPQRLQGMCEALVGELGEEDIYEDYLNHKDKFSDVLCKGIGVRNSCKINKKQKKDKKEEL